MKTNLPLVIALLISPVIQTVVFLKAQESNDPVSGLEAAHKQALEEIAVPLATLKSHYEEALGRLKEDTQKKGDLDGAVKIADEMRDFDKRMERDFSEVPALHRMRKVYEENLARQENDFRSKQADLQRQFARRFEDLAGELTRNGDLAGALRAKEIGEKMGADVEAIPARGTSTYRATVDAVNNALKPFKTDVNLKRGATYRIVPNPRDKWGGGGSKTNDLCNYEGYPGQASKWMRMFSREGDGSPVPVNPEAVIIATGDGPLYLYAEDGSPAGNVGKIRVEIFVDAPPVGTP